MVLYSVVFLALMIHLPNQPVCLCMGISYSDSHSLVQYLF